MLCYIFSAFKKVAKEIRFKAGTTFTLNSGVNHIQNFSCLKSTIRAENRPLYLTWKSNVLLSIDPSTIKSVTLFMSN